MCYFLWATRIMRIWWKTFHSPNHNYHQQTIPKSQLTEEFCCILLLMMVAMQIYFIKDYLFPLINCSFLPCDVSEDFWSIRSIKLSLWGKFSKWCLEFASMSPINFSESPTVKLLHMALKMFCSKSLKCFFFIFNKYHGATQCTADCGI